MQPFALLYSTYLTYFVLYNHLLCNHFPGSEIQKSNKIKIQKHSVPSFTSQALMQWPSWKLCVSNLSPQITSLRKWLACEFFIQTGTIHLRILRNLLTRVIHHFLPGMILQVLSSSNPRRTVIIFWLTVGSTQPQAQAVHRQTPETSREIMGISSDF